MDETPSPYRTHTRDGSIEVEHVTVSVDHTTTIRTMLVVHPNGRIALINPQNFAAGDWMWAINWLSERFIQPLRAIG